MAVNIPSKSLSTTLREEGNKLFLSVDQNLAPVLQRSRFEQALQKYNQALHTAQDVDESVSAEKNVAVVNAKLAKLVDPMKELQLLMYYLKNASEHFSNSYKLSDGIKSAFWKEQLLSSIRSLLEGIDDIASCLSFQKKMSLFEASVYSLKIPFIRAEFCFKIAEMYFHESVYRVADKDFKNCLSRLGDCYRPLAEIEGTENCHPELLVKVDTLKTDIRYQTCWAESLQALETGDKLYADYYPKDCESSMELAWDILDWYKKAIVLTHELEVEIEAIATSRIGRLFDKVLKLKFKARESFKLAIELALSMQPRSFDNQDWFKESKETLERYQQEQVQQESDVWNKERQKYLVELEEELEELNAKAKISDLDLLKWVYSSHPPKNKGQTLPKKLPSLSQGITAYDKAMKELFKKAVVHYHPDRSEPEVNGKKWKVLCEEICKLFTGRYECFKQPVG